MAAVLLGTFAPKLDDKGRLILPAKFWEQLSGGLVMTPGVDRCVYVYSDREFEALHARIVAAPVTTKEGRDFRRVFLSGASQEIPDKQRRVTIPPALRTYAGLERDLAVIGAGDHAEIWDARAWDEFYARTSTGYAEADGEVIAGLF